MPRIKQLITGTAVAFALLPASAALANNANITGPGGQLKGVARYNAVTNQLCAQSAVPGRTTARLVYDYDAYGNQDGWVITDAYGGGETCRSVPASADGRWFQFNGYFAPAAGGPLVYSASLHSQG